MALSSLHGLSGVTHNVPILGLSGVQSLWNVAILEVWMCGCCGGKEEGILFFLKSLTVLQQLKEWDGNLRGWRKMISLQGISSLSQISSHKTLGWFSPVTSQTYSLYSQFNHDCIKSICPYSNFSCSRKFIQYRRFVHLFPWHQILGNTSRLGFTISFHKSFLEWNPLFEFFPYLQMVQNGSNSKESLLDSGYQQVHFIHFIHFLEIHVYQFSMLRLLRKNSEQHCSIELSAMTKMFCMWAVQL